MELRKELKNILDECLVYTLKEFSKELEFTDDVHEYTTRILIDDLKSKESFDKCLEIRLFTKSPRVLKDK